MTKEKRQAIIVIHGIGEQKPMGTLRGFVGTVTSPTWDPKTGKAEGSKTTYYNKPDEMSTLFELRRLTVSADGHHPKTDFFEYYWAYNLRDTKVKNVGIWIGSLLCRNPLNFPKRILWLFLTLWTLIFLSITLIVLGILPVEFLVSLGKTESILGGIVSLVLIPLLGYVMSHYVGDAARYTDPSPENISQRQKIRAEGIELLNKLHLDEKYEKIIIVGHSLGSMIGYDLIKNYWVKCNTKYKDESVKQPVLDSFNKKYAGVKKVDKAAYVSEQEKLFDEQTMRGNPWKISHFITLGSPLVYSSLLLAENEHELEERKLERELLTSPPTPEKIDGKLTFIREPGYGLPVTSLHHAAPFACTKWTNVYYNSDYVGGPLEEVFGCGIVDVKLTINSRARLLPFLAHTKYWSEVGKSHKPCYEVVMLLKEAFRFT